MKTFLTLCFLLTSLVSSAQTTSTEAASAIQPADSVIVLGRTDVEADFSGGLSGWRQFLEKKLRRNVAKDRGAPDGTYTVVARFIVDKEGKVTAIACEVDPGYGTCKEVLRLLSRSPRWTPGYHKGVPVNSYKRQAVSFVVM